MGTQADLMYDWCRRVRRDILALEVWAMRQDPSFRPGGDPHQSGTELTRRIECLEEEWLWLVRGHGLGDPGDPPRGPFG